MSTYFIFFTSVISGLYTSLWGAYKDSPYETFKIITFPRSIIYSVIIFIILYSTPYFRDRFTSLSLIQVFLLVMGIERASAEIYKGFFRKECQDKYFVPSRITFFGKYIASDALLYCVGILSFIIVLILLSLELQINSFLGFLFVSIFAGLACASGGAYKDAPFEGFDLLSFVRSPVILALASPIFYFFDSTQLGFLIFMNLGFERFIVEYYKTYIQRTSSGKFKRDIPRLQNYYESRRKYHYIALIIILVFLIILFLEFIVPR